MQAKAVPIAWIYSSADRLRQHILFYNDKASKENEATAPPPRHGPADGGAGSVRHEREGTTKASGATLFARALAAATQLIKGGGAAQGAHPPPGPPDGHASTKLFFALINLAGRSVPGSGGLQWRRPRRRERCCGGQYKTFSDHYSADHSYGAAAAGAGVPEGW